MNILVPSVINQFQCFQLIFSYLICAVIKASFTFVSASENILTSLPKRACAEKNSLMLLADLWVIYVWPILYMNFFGACGFWQDNVFSLAQI